MGVVVLGAGVSGIAAAYRLEERGTETTVYEAASNWGGLCGSFAVNGFRFDTFAHISFDSDTYEWFENQTAHNTFASKALNYDRGRWLRHPLQEHLYDLPVEERVEIIESFVMRHEDDAERSNYGQWLRAAYGDVFAERYPYRYTNKYWTVEPEDLETKWISGRVQKLTLERMLRGAMDGSLEAVHYSKMANYPKKGGFQAFLAPMAERVNVRAGKCAVSIDPIRREIFFSDGDAISYDRLISTIPLPNLCAILRGAPKTIRQAAAALHYTSGVTVSVGLSKKSVSPAAWFYVYDHDLLPSRISSPSWFSADNTPEGCGSLQAEVYYSTFSPRGMTLPEVERQCIRDMVRMGLFEENEVLLTDVREYPYANIIFTKEIYEARDLIHGYLAEIGIDWAGRFGEWDYLWMGQSLKSGFSAAERILG